MAREIWVDVRVSNLSDPKRSFKVRAMIDNGSTDSAMPAQLLKGIGVRPKGTDRYKGWAGQILRRAWAHAGFRIKSREGVGKVTFESRTEIPTIGATTLEDLGYDIDLGNGGLRAFQRRGPTIRRRPHRRLA